MDENLPVYEKTSGVSGNLSSVGSDTLANLMTLWAEEFKRNYPSVNIQVQAAGSSTAPPALTEGTANFGPMSRAMKDKEIEAFESRFGYKPTAIRVAIDALAVYVHKDSPLDAMSIEQVDAVFSETRRCGGSASVDTWGELGLSGSWDTRPIQLYGRNSVSGTTATSSRWPCAQATSRTASTNNPARHPSCSPLPPLSTALATPVLVM